MCGISLVLSKDEITLLFSKIKAEFMKMRQRGPDYTYFGQVHLNAVLGHHRLAIMDTSQDGNQPFMYVRPDGSRVYCVCNGEIYDYKVLKEKYQIETKSNSDCEIIIPLYEKIGIHETVKLLGSEFAFIILDISSDERVKVIIGRDPIGVRPLYYSYNGGDTKYFCVSSEIKGMCSSVGNEYNECKEFPPGNIAIIDGIGAELTFYSYYDFTWGIKHFDREEVYATIRHIMIESVRKRLMTDRPFGCLLSGGLDSSLVCAIAKSVYKKPFTVFTMSLDTGSTDVPFAKDVADYLGLTHTIVQVTQQQALSAIDETIYAIESWDITTVRASVMQFLLGAHISKTTDIRVLLVGENSDEMFLGYLYEHNAPTIEAAHEDRVRLVRDVHMFDGKRTDRTMAYHGLEVRCPFADKDLVTYVMSIDPGLVVPESGVEKHMLRKAFEGFLPLNVLWRKKEAFSDAVSTKDKSWYQIIQDYIETLVSDEEFESEAKKYSWCTPYTKESYYYRKKFVEFFGDDCSTIIPYYWLPKWTDTIDPSARTYELCENERRVKTNLR